MNCFTRTKIGLILVLLFFFLAPQTQAQGPPPVNNLRIDSMSTAQISISWSPSVGATSYQLSYITNSGVAIVTTTDTTYVKSRTLGATTETIGVKAQNPGGISVARTVDIGSLIIIIDDVILSKIREADNCDELEGDMDTVPLKHEDTGEIEGCVEISLAALCRALEVLGIPESDTTVKVSDLPDPPAVTQNIIKETECEESESGGARQSQTPKLATVWSAYPNPFSQQISVKIESATASQPQLMLFDVMGRKLLEAQMENNGSSSWSAQLETSQFKSGIYNLVLKVEGQVFYKKLIK